MEKFNLFSEIINVVDDTAALGSEWWQMAAQHNTQDKNNVQK